MSYQNVVDLHWKSCEFHPYWEDPKTPKPPLNGIRATRTTDFVLRVASNDTDRVTLRLPVPVAVWRNLRNFDVVTAIGQRRPKQLVSVAHDNAIVHWSVGPLAVTL